MYIPPCKLCLTTPKTIAGLYIIILSSTKAFFLWFPFLPAFFSQVTVMWNSISYLSVASAASTVTLSSVASRCGSPRSKYLMSKSKNGKISCTQLISATTSVRGGGKSSQRPTALEANQRATNMESDMFRLPCP